MSSTLNLLAFLMVPLQAQQPAPSLASPDPVSQLCPERYAQDLGNEGWAVRLDHKWILIDQKNLALLDGLARSGRKDLPAGTADLLEHLEEFHGWHRLPRFVPRKSLDRLTPIGPYGVKVDTNRSGAYTSEGFKKHQKKIAESVRASAAFFNREGESKLVESDLVDIGGVRTLRVLIATHFPDKGDWFLESWTLPGGAQNFTFSVYMLYPRAWREICSQTLRSFVDGFEGIQEAKSPFADGKKLEISWPIILLFLLPFLIVPLVFFRSYKRPAPPRAE